MHDDVALSTSKPMGIGYICPKGGRARSRSNPKALRRTCFFHRPDSFRFIFADRRNRPAAYPSSPVRFATASNMSKITFGDGFPGYEWGSVTSPALLVLQEWWGINDTIKGHAATLAARGYRVLVPDLYKGKIGVDAEEAHHVRKGVLGYVGRGDARRRDGGAAEWGVVLWLARQLRAPRHARATGVQGSSAATGRAPGNLPRSSPRDARVHAFRMPETTLASQIPAREPPPSSPTAVTHLGSHTWVALFPSHLPSPPPSRPPYHLPSRLRPRALSPVSTTLPSPSHPPHPHPPPTPLAFSLAHTPPHPTRALS